MIKKWYIGGEVANIVLNKYGAIDYEWGIASASTDFVSHTCYYLIKYLPNFFFWKGKRYLWFVILKILKTWTSEIDSY